MKKTVLLLLLMLSAISFAQEKNAITEEAQKKHEVKINGLSLIAFEWVDISYEYLIDKESSFGIGTLISFNSDRLLDNYKTFSLTPYYRRYFSKRYAKGFFVEGFGMFNRSKDISRFYNYPYDDYTTSTKYSNNFAIGISTGAKFVTENGFVAEIYLGLGRNLINNSTNYSSGSIVGRAGISLGYRF
jgi:hypothetical protein